jgi:hypothetical protein
MKRIILSIAFLAMFNNSQGFGFHDVLKFAQDHQNQILGAAGAVAGAVLNSQGSGSSNQSGNQSQGNDDNFHAAMADNLKKIAAKKKAGGDSCVTPSMLNGVGTPTLDKYFVAIVCGKGNPKSMERTINNAEKEFNKLSPESQAVFLKTVNGFAGESQGAKKLYEVLSKNSSNDGSVEGAGGGPENQVGQSNNESEGSDEGHKGKKEEKGEKGKKGDKDEKGGNEEKGNKGGREKKGKRQRIEQ